MHIKGTQKGEARVLQRILRILEYQLRHEEELCKNQRESDIGAEKLLVSLCSIDA